MFLRNEAGMCMQGRKGKVCASVYLSNLNYLHCNTVMNLLILLLCHCHDFSRVIPDLYHHKCSRILALLGYVCVCVYTVIFFISISLCLVCHTHTFSRHVLYFPMQQGWLCLYCTNSTMMMKNKDIDISSLYTKIE